MYRKYYDYIVGIDSGLYSISSAQYGLNSAARTGDGVATHTAGTKPSIALNATWLENDFSIAAFEAGTSIDTVYVGQAVKLLQYQSSTLIHSEINVIGVVGSSAFTPLSNLKYTYQCGAGGYTISIIPTSIFYWIKYNTSKYPRLVGGSALSSFGQSVDISRGGNTSENVGGSVTIHNADRFNKYCLDNSIHFNGRPIKIWALIGSQYPTGNNFYPMGTYECEKPSWEVTKYNIPFRSNILTRNVNITKRVNTTEYPQASKDIIGEAVPVAFGRIMPSISTNGAWLDNNVARGIRCADQVDTVNFTNDTYLTNDIHLKIQTPDDAATRPVKVFAVGSSYSTIGYSVTTGVMPNTFDVHIGKTSLWWFGASTMALDVSYDVTSYFDDTYMHITDGAGQDEYRKIAGAVIDTTNDGLRNNLGYLKLGVSDWFKQLPQGNNNYMGSISNQSYCNLISIARQYAFETWPSYGFLDSTAASVSTNTNLFIYDSQVDKEADADTLRVKTNLKDSKFIRVADNSLRTNDYANNNTLDVDLKQYEGDYDSIKSYVVLPIRLPGWSTESLDTMKTDWGLDSSYTLKTGDGLYHTGPAPATTNGGDWNVVPTNVFSINPPFRAVLGKNTRKYAMCVKFRLPIIPNDFTFDKVYLGAWCEHTMGNYPYTSQSVGVTANIRYRRDWGPYSGATIFSGNSLFGSNYRYKYEYISLPDFYLAGFGDGAGYYHYNDGHDIFDANQTFTYVRKVCGYYNYEMAGIDSRDAYDSFGECMLMIETQLNSGDETIDLEIQKLAIIFEKTASLKDKVYSYFSGRTFNNTWDSRKTAANLMTSPVDYYEHACRLQRYVSDADSVNKTYGTAYANAPLIKTSGSGSFDDTSDTNFTSVKAYNVSCQLLDYDKCYTEWIKRTICKNFNLMGYTDRNGYECIRSIVKSTTYPTKNLTLLDIYNRDTIKIVEPDPRNIYCEPFVRYNRNNATGKFDSLIAVNNTWKDAYAAGDVLGYATAPSTLWGYCHALYLKTGIIEKPSSDFTDLWFVNGTDADTAAYQYLTNWVLSMSNPLIRFEVILDKCYNWELGDRFTIALPHQTQNLMVECILSRIIFNLEEPYNCQIEAIMYR